MRFLFRSTVIGLALIVAGCARPPLIPKAPSASRVCCQSWSDIPVEPLSMEETKSVSFDAETSPVFPFPEGNGVFAAYALPSSAEGASLQVRAFVSGGPILSMVTIFRPNAVFLDAARNPLPGPREAPLITRRGLAAWRMSKIATYTVPGQARYVVVYSGSPQSMRSTIASENGTVYGVPYSYTGDVDITLKAAQ
ncbi:hypothetical protein [Cupriavidus pauculus]|uniref:hypothetical protein n=1 Tax=Cupriavidus pauculus TaxID=82633 RepID=UPI000AB46649|nr:hypothetical protein [Cupriavidus pauculus]MBY4730380.1 hypothetical protein [Cupriavidus pauculus]